MAMLYIHKTWLFVFVIFILLLFLGFNNRYCRISGLDSYWTYSLIVQAIVGTFQPNESKTDIQTAESGNPGSFNKYYI